MGDTAREGCNLCGAHSPWYPNDEFIDVRCGIWMMGHMRERHAHHYEAAWGAETRRAFESGELERELERVLSDPQRNAAFRRMLHPPEGDHGADRGDYIEIVNKPDDVALPPWLTQDWRPCADCLANAFIEWKPEERRWHVTVAHDPSCPSAENRSLDG